MNLFLLFPFKRARYICTKISVYSSNTKVQQYVPNEMKRDHIARYRNVESVRDEKVKFEQFLQ